MHFNKIQSSTIEILPYILWPSYDPDRKWTMTYMFASAYISLFTCIFNKIHHYHWDYALYTILWPSYVPDRKWTMPTCLYLHNSLFFLYYILLPLRLSPVNHVWCTWPVSFVVFVLHWWLIDFMSKLKFPGSNIHMWSRTDTTF